MTPLFKRKPVSRSQVLDQTNEHPIDQALPPWNPNEGLGKGFNIVKMIEEHAPNRIKEIDEEIDALNRKHLHLSHEKLQLTKLLGALKD
jgi:hypothetical protein